jgi:FkbM family methyltransferase
MEKVSDFVVLESVYGKFIINRHCNLQAEALIKTGRPHIQAELDNMFLIIDQIPTDGVVVDAGANAGLVCVPVAQRLKEKGGKVHAFEPQQILYYALCGTVALNSLDNLTVYNMGLGNGNTMMTVPQVDYSVDQDFGTVSLLPEGERGEEIAVTNLDSLGLNRLDFLKIDVEGMEIDVLQGAKELIRAHQPWCWIEYWITGVQPIMAEFAELDYTFYKIDALNLLCVPTSRWNREALQINVAPVEG